MGKSDNWVILRPVPIIPVRLFLSLNKGINLCTDTKNIPIYFCFSTSTQVHFFSPSHTRVCGQQQPTLFFPSLSLFLPTINVSCPSRRNKGGGGEKIVGFFFGLPEFAALDEGRDCGDKNTSWKRGGEEEEMEKETKKGLLVLQLIFCQRLLTHAHKSLSAEVIASPPPLSLSLSPSLCLPFALSLSS